MQLSEAARSVWAKSVNDDGEWLPLWQHMDDAADVASLLFDEWLAPSVARLLARQFDGDMEDARRAVVFLACVHDLGKATPAFAVQHELLGQRMREHGLNMPSRKVELDRHLAHHSLAGHQLLVDWLVEQGWSKRAARAWAVVLGGHHGAPPDTDQEEVTPRTNPDLFGTGRWTQVQRELLERAVERCGATERLHGWRDRPLSQQFQVVVTGIVIVSDWIASNEELFGFYADSLPSVTDDPDRAKRALDSLHLPCPWQAEPPRGSVSEFFASRFRLPEGAVPRPVQQAVLDVARETSEPGMLVVEAPMGEGKTEAALAAVETLAGTWQAGGVLVALPTQATTDAMFTRIVDWLDAMGAGDQQVGGSIMLSHGKARFNRLFQGLMRSGRTPRDVGTDLPDVGSKHEVVAHSWLAGRKTGQLANFTVGTIDQLLFAGLKARHLMLRHLGLVGKIVLLDEIHAYDAFMNSYLTKVLNWLGYYGVPVIALSATLPARRREELLNAYQAGRGESGSRIDDDAVETARYPLVSWTEGGRVRSRVAEASGRATTVSVDALNDDADALLAGLREALAEGGCALVVRNTVRRVLETAQHLEREFPGEVLVAHARFITADRLSKDAELLDRFGSPERASTRPERCVVVASQVVEQSLDVDFDLLVTDLAPIDLMLQRMGRLHRHERGSGQDQRPAGLRRAHVWVTGADFAQEPPELEPGAERVYGSYALLRAAAVLRRRFGGTVELPTDIAPLVQDAYGPDDIAPPGWDEAMAEAWRTWRESTDRREGKAKDFQIAKPDRRGKAIIGWLSANVGEADDEAQGQGQVRDGAPTLEVILVHQYSDGTWRTPVWLGADNGALPIPREAVPSNELAEVMARCAIRLPLAFSNERAEGELWEATPEAWEGSPLIYRMPALVLDGDGYGCLDGREARYTPEYGLEVFDSDE
ncbi:CRISPR-associated endonuclease/helicase Cas3 [Haloechinothrix alba]|uniref:CRISPR-associated endonuclease/helicase Cas3 n=1 Tax=Haloechinothrix alba TaxID=664784 RepID=A0A238ZK49_9PSEU|nr:CRISPR-associated helicase/endonuclease Cas3 [Haloechinothrix alba]SNR83785.1 CRISPR-associated endonuclease/helicase Cas3 [Haloechinothrix alba]